MKKTFTTRTHLLAIFCGGFLGTITRYLLSLLIQNYLGKGWPYDILLINISGAFLLAGVTTLADATTWIGPARRLFINVGFLGAYTTFSSLALGDVLLFAHGTWFLALLYLLCSIAGGLLAVLLGSKLAYIFVHAFTTHTVQEMAKVTDNAHLDIDDDILLSDKK